MAMDPSLVDNTKLWKFLLMTLKTQSLATLTAGTVQALVVANGVAECETEEQRRTIRLMIKQLLSENKREILCMLSFSSPAAFHSATPRGRPCAPIVADRGHSCAVNAHRRQSEGLQCLDNVGAAAARDHGAAHAATPRLLDEGLSTRRRPR